MSKDGYAKLTFVLAIIAAVLAFSAAVIKYAVGSKVDIALIAGGLFMLALGFGARKRIAG